MVFGTPLCDIPSGCCSFTGPWTVTRSSLRMLRRVAALCRPLRPVLLLVSFPRSWSPVVAPFPSSSRNWREGPFDQATNTSPFIRYTTESIPKMAMCTPSPRVWGD